MKRATAIYGRAIPILKGKMVRKRPKHTETKEHIPILPNLVKLYLNLPIHLDFCFINGNPYLKMITGKIDYRMNKRFKSRGKVEVMRRLEQIKRQHNNRGFSITEYHTDNGFSNIEQLIAPATLHKCAQGKHEPKSEWNICAAKNHI